ncbi:MAG: 5-formyltetrahydrofolate cyclo-ligase [Lachnospiraceae bacterium]|nr:5-formyltetrahydrofolate cyclo-ligase [Lachnospiraceae bacterium]
MRNREACRREILARRNSLTEPFIEKASETIGERLRNEPVWKEAASVCLYYGCRGEVRTEGLIRSAFDEGKKVFLPRVISDTQMVFIEVLSGEKQAEGAYGIPEPVYDETRLMRETPGLIVVPCVAVDRKGNRLGHGKGYYDRFLEGMGKVPSVCLAFSCQITEGFMTKDTDIRIGNIITEEEIIRT